MAKMIFADAIQNQMKSEKTLTENGAVGYKTTKSYLVDFNFGVSSFRNKSESEIESAFADAYYENPLLAVKLLFFTGDIRQGMGERRTFKTCMKWLVQNHADQAKKVISLIPEYSRWDILVDLLGTSVDAEAFGIIKEQLEQDVSNCLAQKPISLLAKWLPSVNTSSKQARSKARSICARLKLTERNYRKRLSQLRSYSNVVETKMSAKDWGGINYEAVPSKANLLYKDAFLKHDETRRNAYLEALQKGEAKINSSVSFPYDIVHKYRMPHNDRQVNKYDETLEQMWKSLPDYVKGQGENILCVVDGSGSMDTPVGNTGVTCLDVSQSLGIYFAERMPGQFHDQYITFSECPRWVNLSNCDSLRSKISEAIRHSDYTNTNIEKVFRLILNTAVKNHMSQSDMPTSILMISDMEFDAGVDFTNCHYGYDDDRKKTLFENIADGYKRAGYMLPKLVFWNVCSRTGAVPIQENELGVALVSGFSPAIASMVFSGKLSPYDILLEKLNSERYAAVEKALA